MKTLADFDWSFNPKIPKTKIVELASARFVDTHSGVLLIGPPGVGKSHIATAIAIGAIRAGRRALVRSTFDLAADFAEAEATGERRDLVQQLTRVDLLVLEDFGMKKLGSNAAEDLLEVFVRRHETASTLITTNRPTQDWGVFLGDVPGGHRDSRSLPRARDDRPDDRQELSPPPARESRPTTEAVDAAGAVDAQNAPTAPWKSLRDSHKRPPPSSCFEGMKTKNDPRLRAGEESDDTQTAYRVAAFQTFLSGRI